MSDFLLNLHILSAAAWLGGGMLTGFVAPHMARQGGDAATGWAKASAEAGTRFFNPAGVLTLLTGIGLVLISDVYDWSDTFVSIGLGVVVAAALISLLVHRPGSQRMIAALESGDHAAAAGEGKKAAIRGSVTAVLLVVAIVVMVLKTGTG